MQEAAEQDNRLRARAVLKNEIEAEGEEAAENRREEEEAGAHGIRFRDIQAKMDPPEDKRRYHLRDSLSEQSTKHGSDESRRPLTEDHTWGEEGSDAAPSVARSDSGDRVPVSLVPAPLGGLSDLVGQPLHSQLPACGGSRMDRQAIESAADGPVSSRTRSKKQ